MTDPFDADPVKAPLAPLAMPRGRFVGSSGDPIWRVTYTHDLVELVEKPTLEAARASAQRRARTKGWQVRSVGRYLGGPLKQPTPLRIVQRPAILRLAHALRISQDQENAQCDTLSDARSPSDDSTASTTPI